MSSGLHPTALGSTSLATSDGDMVWIPIPSWFCCQLMILFCHCIILSLPTPIKFEWEWIGFLVRWLGQIAIFSHSWSRGGLYQVRYFSIFEGTSRLRTQLVDNHRKMVIELEPIHRCNQLRRIELIYSMIIIYPAPIHPICPDVQSGLMKKPF